MSAIKLIPASGGGSVSLAPPNSTSGSDVTFTLPSASQSFGKIIQVVATNVTSTSSVSIANDGSLSDTPCTVSITSTAANSKFLISATINGEGSEVDYEIGFIMRRVIGGSATNINIGDSSGSRVPLTTIAMSPYYAEDHASTPHTNNFSPYLDSPNQSAGTTITYNIGVRNTGGNSLTYYFGRTVSDLSGLSYERLPQHITVMEVAP